MLDLRAFYTQAVTQAQKEDLQGDFHTTNAMLMFGKENVLNAYKNDKPRFKAYRDKAKQAGLAMLYGGSHKVIGTNNSQSIYKSFFDNLKGFSKHIDYLKAQAKAKGFIKNLYGFIIPIRDSHNDFKAIFNYPIQSSGAFLIMDFLNAITKFTQQTNTNALANSHKQYYNRIVCTQKDSVTPELLSDLSKLDKGNVLFVVMQGDEIIQKSTPLNIDIDFLKKHKLSIYI